uniref:Uncharacterized protein n=1 Tax=Rhizophora mucronata TaxID=61149 RepID=A0A2P2PV28_RHIMU
MTHSTPKRTPNNLCHFPNIKFNLPFV